MRLIDADLLGLTDMEIIMCDGDYKEALKMLIDKIEHAMTIEPEQHWIPCSDGLPEEYGNYLITEMPIGDFTIQPYIATYDPDDDEWTTGSQFRIVRRPVIAWMPLPKSYSERKQDGAV